MLARNTCAWPSGVSNNSCGVRRGTGPSEGVNYHQVKVPRLTPHELFDTPEGHAHVFLANMANRVPVYVPAYYEIATARERARDNPYYAGG